MTTNPLDADRPPELSRDRRAAGNGGGAGKAAGADGRDVGPSAGGIRRRRRDASLMVPDAQFQSYYGHRIVKPAPWGDEISAYLFLGGLAAGSGLLGAGGAAAGYPALRRIGRVTAVSAAALGGGALAKDLGKPSRALNMMRTVKLTSPMSVGSWILAGFSGFSGVALASEVGRIILDADSFAAKALRVVEPPATIGSALFSAPLAAYTAVLLSDTATPTWHESHRELPFVFISSANLAASGWALVTAPAAQNGPARRLAAASAIVELVAFERMQQTMGPTLAEPLHAGRAGALLRASKALTAAGSVGAVLLGRNRLGAAVSGLALMAGSACLRFGMVRAGIDSTNDPKYTALPQRQRLEQRRAQQQVEGAEALPRTIERTQP